MINGETYHFELFGLYNAVMVMVDRETGSIWSHLGGVALDGPLKGQKMEILPLVQTTWENWQALHPDTLVLSEETPYKEWYEATGLGGPALGPEFIASIVYWDERLPYNQVVIGVASGQEFGAYPVNLITAEGGVVNHQVGETPIVLVVEPTSAFSIAYSREVDGMVLEFSKEEGEEFSMVDRQTGTRWDIEGQAIEGPLKGRALPYVPSYLTEWYGWSAYHPDTEIYP